MNNKMTQPEYNITFLGEEGIPCLRVPPEMLIRVLKSSGTLEGDILADLYEDANKIMKGETSFMILPSDSTGSYNLTPEDDNKVSPEDLEHLFNSIGDAHPSWSFDELESAVYFVKGMREGNIE